MAASDLQRMMPCSPEPRVTVVIPAKDAENSIALAIESALREPEVAEVVVVDDGSSDATGDAAQDADDGSGRLTVIRLGSNKGPAFARNVGIAHSTASIIGILDADDFFLAGRFAALRLHEDDWDFLADNLVFIHEGDSLTTAEMPAFSADSLFLDLRTFVEGNTSRGRPTRAELGYLQPVFRRGFLQAHGLRYRESLRLGEDYEFYARALARGARFKLVRTCGYCAVIRRNSLSAKHTVHDLKALCDVDDDLLALALSNDAALAVRRHQRSVRARYELRRFLALKSSEGIVAAGIDQLRHPWTLPTVARGIVADKWYAFWAQLPFAQPVPTPRFLLAPPGDGCDGITERRTRGALSSMNRSRTLVRPWAVRSWRAPPTSDPQR